ncbi:MAG: ABC transporter ATP-binding protein [Alphaproteobacteria bacterium]|nr:ABC transporter ATP-binding protein [Alphaproteobacteria bacterium]
MTEKGNRMLEKVDYKDVINFTWHYWSKRRKTLALLIAMMLTVTGIDTLFPVITGRIIDSLVGHSPRDPGVLEEVLTWLGIYVALSFSFHTLRWAAISLWAWFAVRNLYEIVTDSMRKVQRFSADWHANTFAGGTVRKITRGMWAFDVYGDTLFMGIMPAGIIMITMTGMLLVKLPWVGMFAFTMIVIYTAVSIWMSIAILAPRFRASAKADTKVGATLADIITGNATVKAFGAERREDRVFGRVATLWRLRSQKAWLTSEATNLVRSLLRSVMGIGMMGMTILMWKAGRATPGDIALAITSFFITAGYLRDIGQHISNLQRSVSDMEDVIAFWKREDDVRDIPGAKALEVPRGEIVFDRVKFVYKGQGRALFDDLNVTIRPGEKIALVGVSGSGKSSFVKLVQRLYDVSGGAVRIDGQNIAEVTQESLRQNIALVPQEPILFHRSLAANIAYGQPDATMEDIIAAAKQAYAHDFIENLPLGYGTLVGERGVKLSGGERQRVAIARAILADTPILILDEATSSLDSISEYYIQKALQHLMEGRTTITIAHRLSTIRNADRILVFEGGRIVEQGRHEELLARSDSPYRKLYEMQVFEHA